MSFRFKYFIYGFLFGCMFPICAIIVELSIQNLSFSIPNLQQVHRSNVLIYMIDTAPVFLGLFALIGGVSKEKSVNLMDKFKGLSETLAKSNKRITIDTKSIIEDISRSNEYFKKITKEIEGVSREGKGLLDQNENIARILEKESSEIINAASGLVNLNKEIKGSSKGINEELNNFIPKIEALNKGLENIQIIGNEINILSLNSGIEAHKLGEYGKSFSVISKEVKGLSDKINNMNNSMKELANDSKLHIENLNSLMVINNNTQNEIENITGIIQNHIYDYSEVIKKVSQSLSGTKKVYIDLTSGYDVILTEISKINNDKSGLLGSIKTLLSRESKMVQNITKID